MIRRVNRGSESGPSPRGPRGRGTWPRSRLFHGRVRFLDGRRKRRRIKVAACSVGPDGSGSKPKVVFVHVIFAARVFLKLLVGFSGDPCPGVFEGGGVKLRV